MVRGKNANGMVGFAAFFPPTASLGTSPASGFCARGNKPRLALYSYPEWLPNHDKNAFIGRCARGLDLVATGSHRSSVRLARSPWRAGRAKFLRPLRATILPRLSAFLCVSRIKRRDAPTQASAHSRDRGGTGQLGAVGGQVAGRCRGGEKSGWVRRTRMLLGADASGCARGPPGVGRLREHYVRGQEAYSSEWLEERLHRRARRRTLPQKPARSVKGF